MSGTQGPLETRALTVFPTAAALAAFDATPFESGELSFVVGIGLFILLRDSTTPIDGTTTVGVGPEQSQGRWRTLNSVVSSAILGNDPPVGFGVAAPGTSAFASREDHVHPSTSTTAMVASSGDGGLVVIGSNPSLPASGGVWIGVQPAARTTLNGNVLFINDNLFLGAPPVAGSVAAVEMLVIGTTSFVRGEFDSNTNTTKLAFFGINAPVARPVITGSKGGNAALASLLTGLDALGLVQDTTT